MEFAKSFEEASPSTPIFFILSPGVNPLKDVEQLGKKLGYTENDNSFHNISLGQGIFFNEEISFQNSLKLNLPGQEIVAEVAMDEGATKGHWVILQVKFELFVSSK
jgi:dynein heavy chain